MPKSIGFQYRFTGLDTDPDENRQFILDGSQWQDQLGFNGACTLWYRNNQSDAITTPTFNLFSNTSSFKLSLAYNTQGFIPFETNGKLINFLVSTGISAGAGAIDIIVPFRLFNVSIDALQSIAGL